MGIGGIQDGIENQNETTCMYSYYCKSFDHFSKMSFFDDELAMTILPIEEYPLDEELGDILKTQTTVSSADLPKIDADLLISKVGGFPSFPGEEAFWDDLMNVALIQVLRWTNGSVPFRVPDLWDGYNIDEVAQAVHNEYPGRSN